MQIPIISGLIELGSTWLNGRNEKIKAKAHAEAQVMINSSNQVGDWERIMAQNSGTSLKDEWLTLLISIPLIMAFIPSAVPYVEQGFIALDSMPEYYQYFVGIAFGASFGVRGVAGVVQGLKGKR